MNLAMKNLLEPYYLLPDMPGISIAIWVATSMLFLFFAREPMHKLIQVFSDSTAGGLRKMATWIQKSADKMREKDRKVLLESGLAKVQGEIFQEFHKIDTANTKALAGYPELQLKLDESISKIDDDFQECGQVTPEAPGWSDVVETIARAQGKSGDRIIEKMLGEIHKSAIAGEKKALSELREVAGKRHKILGSMAPVWKRIEKLGKEINSKVDRVVESSRNMDKYMKQYEKLSSGGTQSIDMLASKMTKLFIISLIVIFVGLVGAFINFNLIALPMSELVPAGTRVAGLAVSEVSALVIVALELVLGIFMFEAMGVTHTFPQIAAMTRGKRMVILYGAFIGLLFLSTVELSLAGESATMADTIDSNITVIGQAMLGFVLPWILAVIAIPLEMFIEASQHAFAKFYALFITLVCHLANIVAYIIEGFFKILIHVFDIYIIVPLQLYKMITGKTLSTAK
jgi:hypothetical protein